jgi:hypothetical protein
LQKKKNNKKNEDKNLKEKTQEGWNWILKKIIPNKINWIKRTRTEFKRLKVIRAKIEKYLWFDRLFID